MRVSLENAAQLLGSGRVVAVPTETVYGLAAALNKPAAIDDIFSLKGRPANNPLIIHLFDPGQLTPFVNELPPGFFHLAKAFWPGPMTIVLPIEETSIPAKVRANLTTAAFRVPQHALARDLLLMAGPLVMPSANVSGRPSATCPEHVEIDFGPDFPVLDGGACSCGLESTILIYKEPRWRIIRQGALPAEAFESVLGYEPIIETAGTQPLCPGQLYRHYAPKARLHLTRAFSDEMSGVVLGYKEHAYPAGLQVIPLGSLHHPEEVAENLYRTLRQLDVDGIPQAYVDIEVPHDGLWQTITERLTKASQ